MPPKISISRLGKTSAIIDPVESVFIVFLCPLHPFVKPATIFLLSNICEYFVPWMFGGIALASPRHLFV
jgi:hypothetical protein